MTFRAFSVLASLLFAQPASGQERVSRTLPSGVEVVRDLKYASYGDRHLLLDLYLPGDRRSEQLPVIVVIRGGGWVRGDKEGFGHLAASLAKRGLAAACIEYRATGEATFPAAVEDTKAAVRWLRVNAEHHGLDPDAIGAIGGSAGGHLAAYLGVTGGIPDLEGLGGNQGTSSAVSSVVDFATPTDFDKKNLGWLAYLVAVVTGGKAAVEGFLGSDDPELWKFASPITHVSESSPALLLIHSASDRDVLIDQSRRLAARYKDARAHVELVELPDAPHAFWHFTEWHDDAMDKAAEFFWRHLGRGD